MYGHSDDDPIVTKFILSKKGKIFIDIGANTGFYALNLAKSFDLVIAYEPFPDSVDYMKTIAKRENLENIIIREIAIGNSLGTVEFYLSPRGHKCHSLLPVGIKTIKVPCSTLANEGIMSSIDLVKVDTEGNEFEVLEGALPVMEYIKSWVIEVHDIDEICGEYASVQGEFTERCKVMESYLKSLGYKTRWITKNNVIFAWR